MGLYSLQHYVQNWFFERSKQLYYRLTFLVTLLYQTGSVSCENALLNSPPGFPSLSPVIIEVDVDVDVARA